MKLIFPISTIFRWRCLWMLPAGLSSFLPLLATDPHEDHGDHDDLIILSSAVLAEFGIELAPVGAGTVREEIVLSGEVGYNRERFAYATPRYAGIVLEVRARLGDVVEPGDVLAILESNETLRPFALKSAIRGTVVEFHATPGESVEAGRPLFAIADLSSVWADLRVFARDLHRVEVGQSVSIEGGEGRGRYRGLISYIAPVVDRHTRTGLARVVIENTGAVWKPGLFISGAVGVHERTFDIVVPHSAVTTMDGQPVVFVQEKEGFEARAVVLGAGNTEHVAVVRGLEVGEVIAVENVISLKAEMGRGLFDPHAGHVH